MPSDIPDIKATNFVFFVFISTFPINGKLIEGADFVSLSVFIFSTISVFGFFIFAKMVDLMFLNISSL